MQSTELLQTDHQWSDLVLNEVGLQQLSELKKCAEEQQRCNALFYGPPGTGKTLAASLLGKELAKDVMRVDLSAVISKYIGETEKNLAKLFQAAENNRWILLFDEADALFGKRTEVKDAHDRYANLDTANLLQRIEDHTGLLILETNKRENIDDAFIRRLRYIIHFPIPEPRERLRLWQKVLSKSRAATSDLDSISNAFELTGAEIEHVASQLNEANLEGEEISDKIRKSVKKPTTF